jgi:hypothetical protein
MSSDAAVEALTVLENFADMTRSGVVYVEEVPIDLATAQER